METSLIFLKYIVCIKKFIKTSVKYGVNNLPKQLKIVIGLEFSGLFESPLFLYIGRIAPSSQESGNTPELKIKFKNATYNGLISCAVALIYPKHTFEPQRRAHNQKNIYLLFCDWVKRFQKRVSIKSK